METEEESKTRSSYKKGAALIIGDWIVDEHVTVGAHRSKSSSRTGSDHVRSLHMIHDNIRALCGAGRSASFLYQLKDKDGCRLFENFIGFGFWHPGDTDILASLLDLACKPTYSPHRLKNLDPIPSTDIRLINMHKALWSPYEEQKCEKVAFTNRVVREYRKSSNGAIWYRRLDYEHQQPKRIDWQKERDDKVLRINSLAEELPHTSEVKIVILKDLLKGAITNDVVDLLVKRFPEARWYVSSKKWKPEWRKYLKGVDLRLFMVPEPAADEAIRQSGENGIWNLSHNRPTKQAIEAIEKLHSDIGNSGIVLVQPSGLSILAREISNKSNESDPAENCVVQADDKGGAQGVPMGGSSILLSAIVGCLEMHERRSESAVLSEVLNHSLHSTAAWVLKESSRVIKPPGSQWESNPRKWEKDERPGLLEAHSCLNKSNRFSETVSLNWEEEAAVWNQALSPEACGVVKIGTKKQKQIHLWRSMTEVPGYVCCQSMRKKCVSKLVLSVREFASQPKYPASCLLTGSPGSGKTFLVKRLAEIAGMRFLEFNLTQVTSRSEILGWFDIIRGEQSSNEAPILVFVDEINAESAGDSFYGAFLSIVDDGSFVKAGRSFQLDPCMWVFAGTNESGKARSNANLSKKESDFFSRLTMEPIDLGGGLDDVSEEELKINKDMRNLEGIYLGLSMLGCEFPEVKHVSFDVLRAFQSLGTTTIRDIRQFVRSFKNVQYAQVMSRNLPEIWPGSKGENNRDFWKGGVEDGEMADIEIIF